MSDHIWQPGDHQLYQLHTRLAAFGLRDKAVEVPERRWGCQPAEYYVDAMSGLRARYDALAESSRIVVRIALDSEELELPEFSEAAHGCYVCPSPTGRWISAPSGEVILDGGVGEQHEIRLEPGEYRLLWFMRQDACPFMEPRALPAPLANDPNLAEQVIVFRPLAADEEKPTDELVPEQAVYADWYQIQQIDDPYLLSRMLDEPDELGYRRLVILYRMGKLTHPDTREVLDEIRNQTTQTILAMVARQILTGTQSIAGPDSLEGLPSPDEP